MIVPDKSFTEQIKELKARITTLENALNEAAEKFDGIWYEGESRWLEKEGDQCRSIANNKDEG